MSRRISIIIVAFLSVVWCVASYFSFAQEGDADVGNKIAALMAERRDAVNAMYKSGKVGPERVISANDDLFEAELELSSSKPKRIDLCKKRLENLRAFEEITIQRHSLGAESTDNKLLATAARLKAEIDWLREQAPSK